MISGQCHYMRMDNQHETIGYRGFYLERSGENSAVLVENLLAPPERPLSEEERRDVYNFESDLYELEVKPGITIEEIIRSGKSEDSMAPLVFPEAFIRGEVNLSKLPEASRSTQFSEADDVYKWFAELTQNDSIEKNTLLKMAKDSADFYRAVAKDALLSGKSLDASLEQSLSIVLDTKREIGHAENVFMLRDILLELRGDYTEQSDNLEGSKRAIIDVYLAKINSMCGTSIVRMDYIKKQAEYSQDEELAHEATSLVPQTFKRALDEDAVRESLLRRLDYLSNGMGLDKSGTASAVSARLFEVKDSEPEEMEVDPVFTNEETERLKAAILQPEQLDEIVSNILRKANLLSSEDASTWYPTRTHRASDNLFQVVENPGKSSFAVDTHSGVYKYASVPRPIYNFLLVGCFHELTHVNQGVADERMGRALRIATLKGKRCAMLREGGANARHRNAERELFGVSRPAALTYPKAYRTLHETGSIYEAAKTFYDEKTAVHSDIAKEDAAKEAVDRVLRLKRLGGYSSGALSYAEGAILQAELSDKDPALLERAMMVTSLDLVDQVRLHRYGLLPEVSHEDIEWDELIMEEMKPYIEAALNADTNRE